MIVKKAKKTVKAPSTKKTRPMDWRDAIRLHLAKVAEVDAVFVSKENGTLHVYSVVHDFEDDFYEMLLKKESLIEKAFPRVSFEFHTRAHQGREPHFAAPW